MWGDPIIEHPPTVAPSRQSERPSQAKPRINQVAFVPAICCGGRIRRSVRLNFYRTFYYLSDIRRMLLRACRRSEWRTEKSQRFDCLPRVVCSFVASGGSLCRWSRWPQQPLHAQATIFPTPVLAFYDRRAVRCYLRLSEELMLQNWCLFVKSFKKLNIAYEVELILEGGS